MSDTHHDTPAGRRGPRWMWVVLLLSVALNLIVVGLVLGAVFHFRGGHGDRGIARFLDRLPDVRQNELREKFRSHRTEIRPLRREARRARRAVRDVFESDALDQTVLEARLEEATAARLALLKARQDWIARLGRELNADERQAYLSWLRHKRRFRHRGRRFDD